MADDIDPVLRFLGTMEASGGPAFPIQKYKLPSGGFYRSPGMSLRDWLAGQALNAIVGNSGSVFPGQFAPWSRHAEEAYKLADAMLEERSK